MKKEKKVRVLINPRSGFSVPIRTICKAIMTYWEDNNCDVVYQFCRSVDDGIEKAGKAISDGVDVILAAGGDGTVNSIARVLIGSEVALGVIPTGSGNGFARHFEIPLNIEQAVKILSEADTKKIDVAMLNNRVPFVVTCSMAWDASIASAFEKSAFRGIIPYIFAGLNEFFDYQPQHMTVEIDGKERHLFHSPVVFTIANLTQYGAGVRIAPLAREDDGLLELVVVQRKDIPRVLPALPLLFSRIPRRLPEVTTISFKHLKVFRKHPTPIQIDGEPYQAGVNMEITVKRSALTVLVPKVIKKRMEKDTET